MSINLFDLFRQKALELKFESVSGEYTVCLFPPKGTSPQNWGVKLFEVAHPRDAKAVLNAHARFISEASPQNMARVSPVLQAPK